MRRSKTPGARPSKSRDRDAPTTAAAPRAPDRDASTPAPVRKPGTGALPTIHMSHHGDDNSEEKLAMSDEKRFYYLRLMAKPNRERPEPITTKFYAWTEEDEWKEPPVRPVRAEHPALEVHTSFFLSGFGL